MPSLILTRRRPCAGCEPPFGFVEVLWIVDHDGQDQDDDAIAGDDQAPPVDR